MDIREFKELWIDDRVISVHRDIDDSWRHGNYVYEVYHKLDDDTYWAVSYRESGDGEYHELRECECADPVQVKPIKKIVETVEYVTVDE